MSSSKSSASPLSGVRSAFSLGTLVGLLSMVTDVRSFSVVNKFLFYTGILKKDGVQKLVNICSMCNVTKLNNIHTKIT